MWWVVVQHGQEMESHRMEGLGLGGMMRDGIEWDGLE